MKKIFSIALAVIMVVMAVPFTAFAWEGEVEAGVTSVATTDAQITSNVCSIWYYDDNGVWTKQADYASMDAAFEGMRDRYVGPLADESIVDTNDNGLSDELYEAAGSPVIKINGNFQGDYARPNWATNNGTAQIKYDMNKVITIVIDGAKNENENWTITYGTSDTSYDTNTFNYLAYYNLTVKNTNMIINSGTVTFDGTFLWQGNSGDGGAPGTSYTIFENCLIQQNATSTSGSGSLFKMNGNAKYNGTLTADPCLTDKYNLILKDTTVEAGTGLGHQAHWGADVNIELHNSIMALTCKGGDNSNNNDALLKFYEAGKGRVYLDGTSKLIGRRSDAGATIALIRVLSGQKASVEIVLEEGAELSMQNTASLTRKTYIAAANGDLTTVTDNGAIYSASALDAKTGVDLPIALKDNTWLAGAGIEGTVAHPTSTTTDETTGDETTTTDTSRLVYVDADATHGVALTSTGTAPITLKKNGAAVAATAEMTDLNAVFDYIYAQADSDAYTAYLNGSMTTSEYFNPETYDSTAVKTVRIDGQGFGLMSYNSTATFYGIGLYNLKLSNMYIVSSAVSALDWSPRLTPSDAYANYIATGSNPVVDTYAEFTNITHTPRYNCSAANLKLKGGNSGAQNLGTYNITMTDSTFVCTAADTMFMMNDKGNLNLNVIGSKLIYRGGASNNDGNNYIFALNGAQVDINVENSENNVSVIDSDSQSTRVTSGIVNNGTGYAVNITLGEGVELKLGANDAKTSARFVYSEKTTTTITDNGAKWIVKANLLDNGAVVTLPTSMFKDATKDHVWYLGEDAIANPYGDIDATADVVLTHAIPVDPAEGNVAYIEIDGTKTYYATLKTAIDALGALYDAVTTENLTDDALWQAAGSPVIYLYEDITITSETNPSWLTAATYDANRVRTVVIKAAKADGTNAVITSTNAGATFGYNAYYNLTLENIDLTCTQGFALFWRGYNLGQNSGKSTTNMINCNISATGTSGEGLVFKVTGNQLTDSKTEDYIINMVNTDITAQKGVNAVFLLHHGCAGTLNIDGDSSIHHVMNKNATGGDTMFMLGTNRKFVINVADGANLSADLQVGRDSADYKSYAVFRCEGTNSYPSADGIKNEINVESGVNIAVNAADSYAYKSYIVYNALDPVAKGAITNVNLDDGATYAFNAKAASLGFSLYYGEECNKGEIIGMYINGDTTKLYNSVVPAGAVTTAITDMTPVFYTITADDFDMEDGAALRTVRDENGIRFTSKYSKALLEQLAGAKTTFGTLIAPTAVWGENELTLENAATLNAEVDGQVLNLVSTKPVASGDYYKINAAVIMEPANYDNVTYEDIYNLVLAARAYMTITYADGSTATYYTAFDAENVRIMYNVADALRAVRAENEVIDNILNVCEPTAE